MRKIHWPSFRKGFLDGLSGGPLWRFLFCALFGHDWETLADTQDDVFTYYGVQCRCCGKYRFGAFKHYSSDRVP